MGIGCSGNFVANLNPIPKDFKPEDGPHDVDPMAVGPGGDGCIYFGFNTERSHFKLPVGTVKAMFEWLDSWGYLDNADDQKG